MFVLHSYIVQRVLEKKRRLTFAFLFLFFVRKSGSTSVARAFASFSHFCYLSLRGEGLYK